jgi:hypothetical protein
MSDNLNLSPFFFLLLLASFNDFKNKEVIKGAQKKWYLPFYYIL